MGRPREFDIDEALDAAMAAFWARGYESTSMADLIEATGLQKGSLYKAFGDKHSLFLQSLDRYAQKIMSIQSTALAQGKTPKASLQAWFDAAIDYAIGEEGQPRGCLAMNTLVELGPHDEVVAERLMYHKTRFIQLISSRIKAGQDEGTFRGDVPADTLADILFTYVMGMVGCLKGAFEPKESRRNAEALMTMLTAHTKKE